MLSNTLGLCRREVVHAEVIAGSDRSPIQLSLVLVIHKRPSVVNKINLMVYQNSSCRS